MIPEEEKFHRRLRVYDRHLIFLVLGIFLGGLGICTAPWGVPLIIFSGLFQVLAGLKAREGGRSAVTGLSIGFGSESFGVGTGQHWTTRELEAMSNQERLDHAHSTGRSLIACGILVIVVGLVFILAVFHVL